MSRPESLEAENRQLRAALEELAAAAREIWSTARRVLTELDGGRDGDGGAA